LRWRIYPGEDLATFGHNSRLLKNVFLPLLLSSRFGKAGADSAAVTEPRASASGNEKCFLSTLPARDSLVPVFDCAADRRYFR
jgi:hypothetical protein